MCDLSTKETSDNYVQVVAQLSKGWRVIRCRHDLQWIIQNRSPADLNKGRWVGHSYHMTLERLRASCLGVRELQNDKTDVLIDEINKRSQPKLNLWKTHEPWEQELWA